MANQEHLAILKQGADAWNLWREKHPEVEPDLSGADLSEEALRAKQDLVIAPGMMAGLLSNNRPAIALTKFDLRDVDLRGAKLSGQNLEGTILTGADLRGADLTGARLINVNLERAQLVGCRIFGISVWNIKLAGAAQEGLIITQRDEPTITVDNLEVAQFIYLLLNNDEIRQVIDTITSKVVLILGRFTPERKTILDAIRKELRMRNYLPVLFDFDKPANRNMTETVSTLAHMARFVIADITDPKSIPQELQTIVPHLPSVPILTLLHASGSEYGMYEAFRDYPWVSETHRYQDIKDAIGIITGPGLAWVEAQQKSRKRNVQ